MKFISKILNKLTWVLIGILGLILIYTAAEFIVLVFRTMINRTAVFDLSQKTIDTDQLFIVNVQGLLAGVLLIIIIIELIHSLLASLDKTKKSNYLLILYEIATIAVVRHLFIYELDHIKGINIIGIAFLILILGLFNLIYRPELIQRMRNKISSKNET